MSDERREFQGAAVDTTITGAINSTATNITIADATGWPSGGANGKFYAELDHDTATPETILVQSRSGTTLTLASASDRGKDGTSATSHSSGATIRHVFVAQDADEANYWVNQLAKGTTAGDTIYYSAARTLARRAVGTDEQIFKVSGGLPVWGQVDTDGLTDGAVEDAKIGTGQLLEGKHATGLRHVYVQAAQPGTPFNGQHWFDTDNGQTRVYYGTTGFQKLWDVAWGTVGYAQVTANQASISSAVDLTSLTLTFTAVANRRYRWRVVGEITPTVADGAWVLALTDGSNTQVKRTTGDCATTNAKTADLEFVHVPGAGSITRKARLSKPLGTGTLTWGASADNPSFILVEDIGPSADPTLV